MRHFYCCSSHDSMSQVRNVATQTHPCERNHSANPSFPLRNRLFCGSSQRWAESCLHHACLRVHSDFGQLNQPFGRWMRAYLPNRRVVCAHHQHEGTPSLHLSQSCPHRKHLRRHRPYPRPRPAQQLLCFASKPASESPSLYCLL